VDTENFTLRGHFSKKRKNFCSCK